MRKGDRQPHRRHRRDQPSALLMGKLLALADLKRCSVGNNPFHSLIYQNTYKLGMLITLYHALRQLLQVNEVRPDRTTDGDFIVPWIGLKIDRRTDFLAAAAFLMALTSGLVQLYHGWQGAKVSVFAPEQVILVMHDYGNGRLFLRVGARMAYVNLGRPGYNATIRREVVEFSFGGQAYQQVWHSNHRFYSRGNRLYDEYVAEAKPFPINAGSSISREVYFVPPVDRCKKIEKNCKIFRQYIGVGKTISSLAQIASLKFTFRIWLFGQDKPLDVECVIDISEAVIDELVLNGWVAPPCWPS